MCRSRLLYRRGTAERLCGSKGEGVTSEDEGILGLERRVLE